MEKDRCVLDDFDVFLTVWNVTQNHKTPTIHSQIAIWLQKCWEHGHRRLLLQAFRASGKSTLAAIFCAWILCKDPDLRILVLSAELTLASKMVRNIKKVMEKHPWTTHLVPDHPDEWASHSFTIKRKNISRDPSVLGRGLYSNITGIRADIIICDDVEVPNTCDTADKRKKLRTRLLENEFILNPQGKILFIGTPHSYYSIYAEKLRKEIREKKLFLSGYRRKTIPVLNRQGKSAWPERYSLKRIEEIRMSSGPMQFSSQMMLKPVNVAAARLDITLLRPYDDGLFVQEIQRKLVLSIGGHKMVSASAWWDPSFGKSSGDSSVLAIVLTDENGGQWLHRVVYINVDEYSDVDEATQQCAIVARHCEELFVPVLYIEGNGIGKFLPKLVQKTFDERFLATSVIEKHARIEKSKRILESFDVAMAAKSLNVHQSVYDTPFVHEMSEWRPFVNGVRDDGLDAAAGALSAEPIRIKRMHNNKTKLWHGAGENHVAKTEFDV